MQTDLRDKVASGTLGFNKRAKNILKAVLVGAGIDAVGFGYSAFKMGKDFTENNRGEIDSWLEKNPGKKAHHATEAILHEWGKDKVLETFQKHSTTFKITNVVAIGSIIGSTILLNKASKRKQEGNLSAVETELAKREMKTREINEPQRG